MCPTILYSAFLILYQNTNRNFWIVTWNFILLLRRNYSFLVKTLKIFVSFLWWVTPYIYLSMLADSLQRRWQVDEMGLSVCLCPEACQPPKGRWMSLMMTFLRFCRILRGCFIAIIYMNSCLTLFLQGRQCCYKSQNLFAHWQNEAVLWKLRKIAFPHTYNSCFISFCNSNKSLCLSLKLFIDHTLVFLGAVKKITIQCRNAWKENEFNSYNPDSVCRHL